MIEAMFAYAQECIQKFLPGGNFISSLFIMV